MSKIPGFRSGKAWKKVIATIGYLFIVLIIYGMVKGGGGQSTAPTTAPAKQDAAQAQKTDTAQPTQTQTPAPQPTPAPAPTPSVKTYKAGMYKIGSDMPAGEYVLIGSGMSYYQVAKDSTGQLDSLISNDNFSKRSIITLSNGQYLTLKNCTAYAFKDAPKVEPLNGILPEGMYKVGVDLPAGEYKVNADSMGYVEVSTSSTHNLDSIVSNDNFQGEKYITVKDGQYIKLTRASIKIK